MLSWYHHSVSLHNGSYIEASRLGGRSHLIFATKLSDNGLFCTMTFNLISAFSHSRLFPILAYKTVNSCLRSPVSFHALLNVASHNSPPTNVLLSNIFQKNYSIRRQSQVAISLNVLSLKNICLHPSKSRTSISLLISTPAKSMPHIVE